MQVPVQRGAPLNQHSYLQQDRRTHQCSRRRLHICAAVKEKTGKQIVCSKTLVAKEASKEKVLGMCKEVLAFSEERMKDKSNGIQQFQCVRDSFEDNTFHFYERYVSNLHLGQHNTTVEVMKFMQNVQPHLEGPIGMALYEFKNGKIGYASVQGGPKGEGGLDDATGG